MFRPGFQRMPYGLVTRDVHGTRAEVKARVTGPPYLLAGGGIRWTAQAPALSLLGGEGIRLTSRTSAPSQLGGEGIRWTAWAPALSLLGGGGIRWTVRAPALSAR